MTELVCECDAERQPSAECVGAVACEDQSQDLRPAAAAWSRTGAQGKGDGKGVFRFITPADAQWQVALLACHKMGEATCARWAGDGRTTGTMLAAVGALTAWD